MLFIKIESINQFLLANHVEEVAWLMSTIQL